MATPWAKKFNVKDYEKIPFDEKKFPFSAIGYRYALQVVQGKIIACQFVIGACKRSLYEINEKFHADWVFVPEKAEHYLRTTQRFHHVNGKWATPNIVYDPWQCFIWMNIMGFISRDTLFRRFRLAHIEIPRGSGKSAMASQSGLYFLSLDDPNGNQISTVATKKDQARIVFDAARNMALKNPSFLDKTGTEVQQHKIVHPKSNSFMRPLAADAKSMDGLNDVLAILDELHAMARKVFDVVVSGMSKRKDSLTLCITTAGFDLESVGHSQSTYAKQLCLGEFTDDRTFAIVYTLDEGDDHFDEKVWPKANPGSWTDWDEIRAKVEKARRVPADLPNVLTKHFNIWIAEAKAYFDQKKWDLCADPNLNIEDFKGKKCMGALDLASYIDLSSVCRVFKDEDGKYCFFWENYLPEERIKQIRSDVFDQAVVDGSLIASPGEVINYDKIAERILEMDEEYKFDQFAYDEWRAAQIAQQCSSQIEMFVFPMRYSNISEPMKKFAALILEGKVRHKGFPLIRWCLGNVIAKRDPNDNVKPDKSHERLKIDPIVTALMALALWLNNEETDSVYEGKELFII